MKARDVVAVIVCEQEICPTPDHHEATLGIERNLLAQTPLGEPVVIMPDGELMALDGDGYQYPDDGWYRLVHIEGAVR